MTNRTFLRRALLCSTVGAVLPGLACAQSLAPPQPARTGKLEEVVVTAARKVQTLQKTSMAVTAITGDTIRKQAESNILEVLQNVPDVTINNQQHGYSVNIRGQGADLPPGSGQGAVAIENDGVYNLLFETGVIGYYDLARVEVLPGPQGTLYGVNSDGGVVNIISNDPVLGRYSGGATATIGNYDLYRVEGEANIPISDTLALRVAGAMINRHGYYTPDQGDAVAQSGRVKLLYKPNDKLSVLLMYQGDHIGGVGQADSLAFDYQNGDINKLKNPWGNGAYTTSGPGPQNSQQSDYQNRYQANISYQIGDAAVINILPAYITNRDRDHTCATNGFPGSIGPGICATHYDPAFYQQISSEERITNAPGARIQWDVGAYHWNYRQLTLGRGNPSSQGQHSDAGFGEFTYPVIPSVRIIGGVRQSYDTRNYLEAPGNDPSRFYTLRASFHHFDYRGGVEWDAMPRSMEYFTVSTGYRPGGFNQSQSVDGSPSLFQTEQITSFELGSKNRFLNNTLQVNGDVFYYDEKNYQLLDQYQADVEQNGVNICNVGPYDVNPVPCQAPTLNLKAHVLGLELQTRYNATPVDQIGLSFALLDSKFGKTQNGTCVPTSAGAPAGGCYFAYNSETDHSVQFVHLNGLDQPHSPAASGNLTYQHRFVLASGADITAGAEIFATSGYYVYPLETAYTYQPAYTKQNASIAYNAASGKWSLNAYMRNISNYAVKSSFQSTNIDEPRTFGFVGSYRF